MVRAIPSKVSPKFLTGGGAASPPPASANTGTLVKTSYGYLSREGADVTGISYTSDWSLVVGMFFRSGDYTGDYFEVIGHRRDASTFNWTRPGWSLCGASSGYDPPGSMSLGFLYSDGSGTGYQLAQYVPAFTGFAHYVFTFDATTKTLTSYVNGVLNGSSTNALFTNPASIPYPLVIGGNNKTPCTTYAAGESFFSSSKNALPAFKLHQTQLWQKKLSGAEALALYNSWNGTGNNAIPGGVTGTPVSGYDFKTQCGDKNGAAGTGWLKDGYGGNHLFFVDTNPTTGATGTVPYLSVPSGALRIVNISSGDTGVSGGTVIKAGGLTGTGNAQQYWIQADKVNTFDGPALQESGWLMSDGEWPARLDPGSVYFMRVKGRNGDTLTESAWSSTIFFSTRNAIEWYVRPLSPSTTKVYGTQDGTSYANAWNGLRWNGWQGGSSAVGLQGQADGRNMAPGDKVWHCGFFGPIDTSSFGAAQGNQPYFQSFIGDGRPNYPIKLAFNHPTYPGGFIAMRRPTSSYGWVDQGGGVWATTVSIDPSLDTILFDETNSGFPTLGNSIQNKSYYKQSSGPIVTAGWYTSGGTTYVRLPDGSNPGNRIYFARFFSEYINCALSGNYQTMEGGTFAGTNLPYYGTHDTFSGVFARYSNQKMIQPVKYRDYLTVEDCEVAWAAAGVYGTNEGVGNCGDNITVRRNWFHHIGTSPQYEDGDSHCIGVQSGNYWTIVDNLCEYSGPSIELWSQSNLQTYNLIARNVTRKASNRQTAEHPTWNSFAAGLVFSNGSHTVGTRTGNQWLHNVSFDHEGNAFHDSCSDLKDVKYNLFCKTGQGANYNNSYGGGPSGANPFNVDFQFNVVVDPVSKFISQGGNGTGTLTFNNNLYWDPVDTASTGNKFSVPGVNGGASMSFTGWQAYKDANSYFENPLTSAHVPAGFDDLMIKGFCRSVLCDFDGDGSVTAADLTYFDAYAAGNGPRIAARKLLQNLITYGAY